MHKDSFLQLIKESNPNANIEEVSRAFDICKKYHKGQLRKSGEAFYNHPVEVAIEVSKLGMDDATIIVALLHDTIEDTELTKEEVAELFNKEIADMVDGVTKLEKIKFQEKQIRQVENFRKLFLAISKDVRVLIVKLCDRLHNMRTIDYHSNEQKKESIAIETLEIYAPLAERIGLQGIKNEMQDICFKILKPELYEKINTEIDRIEEDYKTANVVEDVVNELELLMKKNGIECRITGRKKQPYSVWLKTRKHNLTIDDLADIIAFRVIVDKIENCYRALGIIHMAYYAVPKRFDDYISTPKINHYQSLHTTVMGPKHHLVEIQIRTEKMHDEAEYGMASHWRYKQSTGKHDEFKRIKAAWVDRVLRILEQKNDPLDMLKSAKLEIGENNIFVFNIDGTMVDLPLGATVLDFAFYLDSSKARFFEYAKINGETVDLSYRLKNGEKIEVFYSNEETVQPNWINHVITGEAKSGILKNR